ncbi:MULTISPECIES: Crp/Fnr family transcriptional regulator [Thermomonosporaceae]|uniref:Crp/Fnr family transcriptional regulator n=1 Tax=Thermomonosporaceae TaxID=2012 RepID=UPI00255A8EF4|nr:MULTISPECIES: Crp/Fnr family transcriptional regulator [Thermomonosporaceae]MDL4777206.1 Crp/Fnr family transcriptional regulator [Actinomadura xylanilytica]
MEITPFWDALPGRAREALRQAGTVVMIKPGAFLTREHTRSSQVFVLHSGAVKVWVDRQGETVILDVLGPGDLVGELEAVDAGVRHASVEALTPVQALVLPADRFRTVLEAHPGSVWAVAGVLAERLRDADELRVLHFPDDPERRLAGRLLRLVARFGTPLAGGAENGHGGSGYQVQVPLCQQDLGRWAGMGRRKVAQILAGEPVRGGITVTRNMIVVRSVDALRRLSGDRDTTSG